MIALQPFSQETLLQNVADTVARAGVCVALCDHWLRDIKLHPDAAPAARLDALKTRFHEVVSDQVAYARRRAEVGPTVARRESGHRHGLAYEEQTTISRAFLDMGAIRRKLAGDLAPWGATATWSMRFLGGGGHAIAGFHGIVRETANIHRARMHLFDPNIGEYTGDLADLDAALQDLLEKFPLYRTVSEIRRVTEG